MTNDQLRESDFRPENELKKGEAILVRVDNRAGGNTNLAILGLRDRDNQPTYLPVFYPIEEDGKPNRVANMLGIDSFAETREISETERARLFESLDRMPLLLAVDRTFNGPIDDIDEYPVCRDGTPVQIMGIIGPPQTGKTTFLIDLIREGPADPDNGFIRIFDLDDLSPQSLTKTLDWLSGMNKVKELGAIQLFDAIQSRFEQSSSVEKNDRIKPNLRDRLNALRQQYKAETKTEVDYKAKLINQGGWVVGEEVVLRKLLWLVDLPGINVVDGQIQETRELDLYDWLWLTMPNVELFKASERLQVWELPLQRDLFDRDVDREMGRFVDRLPIIERSLMGYSREELKLFIWRQILNQQR